MDALKVLKLDRESVLAGLSDAFGLEGFDDLPVHVAFYGNGFGVCRRDNASRQQENGSKEQGGFHVSFCCSEGGRKEARTKRATH